MPTDIFRFQQWKTDMSTPTGWHFYAGDFNGDGVTDIVGYHPSNGTLWVGINTGSGRFDFGSEAWAVASME